MTLLVTIEPEEGGYVLRRWAKNERTEGRLVLTHAAGVDGEVERETVQNFRTQPPQSCRVGFENAGERSWEPTAA